MADLTISQSVSPTNTSFDVAQKIMEQAWQQVDKQVGRKLDRAQRSRLVRNIQKLALPPGRRGRKPKPTITAAVRDFQRGLTGGLLCEKYIPGWGGMNQARRNYEAEVLINSIRTRLRRDRTASQQQSSASAVALESHELLNKIESTAQSKQDEQPASSLPVEGGHSVEPQITRQEEERIIYRPPGIDEREIFICDQEPFENSPWLREKEYVGHIDMLLKHYPSRRVAALSLHQAGGRRGRFWYLRRADRFDLPCPIEAVIPSTIRVNGQSTPYYTIWRELENKRAPTNEKY